VEALAFGDHEQPDCVKNDLQVRNQIITSVEIFFLLLLQGHDHYFWQRAKKIAGVSGRLPKRYAQCPSP
jgi:hypothetical protein